MIIYLTYITEQYLLYEYTTQIRSMVTGHPMYGYWVGYLSSGNHVKHQHHTILQKSGKHFCQGKKENI